MSVIDTNTLRNEAMRVFEETGLTPLQLLQDVRRYQQLRAKNWNDAPFCVVINPKKAVKLGHDCPSLDRLDALIDEDIQNDL